MGQETFRAIPARIQEVKTILYKNHPLGIILCVGFGVGLVLTCLILLLWMLMNRIPLPLSLSLALLFTVLLGLVPFVVLLLYMGRCVCHEVGMMRAEWIVVEGKGFYHIFERKKPVIVLGYCDMEEYGVSFDRIYDMEWQPKEQRIAICCDCVYGKYTRFEKGRVPGNYWTDILEHHMVYLYNYYEDMDRMAGLLEAAVGHPIRGYVKQSQAH